MRKKGEFRTEILDTCPTEFKDKLSGFIDDIEYNINSAATELGNISDPCDMINVLKFLEKLGDSLY